MNDFFGDVKKSQEKCLLSVLSRGIHVKLEPRKEISTLWKR